MNTVTIVAEAGNALGPLVAKQLPSNQVTLTHEFDGTLKTAETIVWVAMGERVDDQVFDLIDQVDARQVPPVKIVMVSLAGVNGELTQEQMATWYGDAGNELMLAHQYAIKMIDELEIDYTIIRCAPMTSKVTSMAITNEGQPMHGTQIGLQPLSQVVADACQFEQYRNQSIGVSDQ